MRVDIRQQFMFIRVNVISDLLLVTSVVQEVLVRVPGRIWG